MEERAKELASYSVQELAQLVLEKEFPNTDAKSISDVLEAQSDEKNAMVDQSSAGSKRPLESAEEPVQQHKKVKSAHVPASAAIAPSVETAQDVKKVETQQPTAHEIEKARRQRKKAEKAQKKLLKNKKAIDWSKYRRRHIALRIVYIGANFHGFVAQKDKPDLRTVETELFRALKLTRLVDDIEKCCYSRCGRTDKGVSATGQVIGIVVRSTVTKGFGLFPKDADVYLDYTNTDKKFNGLDEINLADQEPDEGTEIRFGAVLNGALPVDVRVVSWCPAPLTFSARFSCIGRTYKYFFSKDNLDIAKMKEAAKLFIGQHDFRNFCALDLLYTSHFNRSVLDFTIEPLFMNGLVEGVRIGDVAAEESARSELTYTHPEDKMYVMTITANAFLYHQVRCMTSMLFYVGRGVEPPSIVSDLLDLKKHPLKPAYNMASEKPLVLWESYYPKCIDFDARLDMDNLQRVFAAMHAEWRNQAMMFKITDAALNVAVTEMKNSLLRESKTSTMEDVRKLLWRGHQLKAHQHDRRMKPGGLMRRPKERSLADRVEGLSTKKKEMRAKITAVSEKYREHTSYKWDIEELKERIHGPETSSTSTSSSSSARADGP